jgi:ubiquinone/menaquinone biosynthesis C-methylase UbiE
MGKAEWGAEPEFFGPRHAHREGRILSELQALQPGPGRHLECAAGVGSLSVALARAGHTVVAADTSALSLAVLRRRAAAAGVADRVVTVVADITALPFRDGTFDSTSSAETLEHVPDHQAAASELARVMRPGGSLVGTVPAGPEQWSDWDVWASHLRRYTVDDMRHLLEGAGLEARAVCWGWPVGRLYDELFLKRVNRRRYKTQGPVRDDPTLRTVAGLGQRRWLVRLVCAAFALDRLFDGTRWGVGLLFAARKPGPAAPQPKGD